MLKMKLGRTIYIVNDDHPGSVMNEHAKCTGKHRTVKSKGAELRRFPDYWDGMSTADYVAMYYGLNSSGRSFPSAKGAPYGKENTLTGFYENLNTAPAATYTEEDIYENEG
jgi:hypothetical protein